MFQLLSPLGLWALTALALPLAIHLWRPPPRTVRLGSLRFLENLPRRLHDLRWRERLLLAARLALLALLTLLLAGPIWQRRLTHTPQRWILLDSAARPSDGSLDRLRALKSAGYELRSLAPGFAVVPAPGTGAEAAMPDVWSLLREADAELPAGSSLAVFSPGQLRSLRGSRPALRHCRVEWVQTPDAPPPPPPVPTSRATPTAPLIVLILHDADRAADAHYVAAAVHAAGAATGHGLTVRTRLANALSDDAAEVAWFIWLSAQPVPPTWTEHVADVVSEAAQPANGLPASWIVPAPDAAGAAVFFDPIRLWQRTPPLSPPGAVCWTDGFGQPLLTVTREGRGRHWRFFGRFDPAWTDLLNGSAFPAWVRALLWPPAQSEIAALRDRRQADPSQCLPASPMLNQADETLQREKNDSVDLRGPLWLLAAAFFMLERGLSLRRPPSRMAPSAETTPFATAVSP